jgi:EAL domain-containing protein (putative c-di-GMP-specific phosphodiesterase class I)
MQAKPDFEMIGCDRCRELSALEFGITMAYQPIVDVAAGSVYGYEALVRGVRGESAGEVLARVNDNNCYRFDQACRVRAIEIASGLGLDSRLSINFLPNAVYRPETCIRATLEAAKAFDFPAERIMFELTESEPVRGTLTTAEELGVQVIAEGIDHPAEYQALRALGATLFQGYLFAKPEVEALPTPQFP